MPDIPEEAVQAAAAALGAHPWNSYPHAAHREHNFDSACMVCRADLEPIARVVLEAAVDALAGAGLVVVSACACGQPIGTCHPCGQPRCWHCDPGLGKGYQPMKCNARHEPARAALPERRTDG